MGKNGSFGEHVGVGVVAPQEFFFFFAKLYIYIYIYKLNKYDKLK